MCIRDRPTPVHGEHHCDLPHEVKVLEHPRRCSFTEWRDQGADITPCSSGERPSEVGPLFHYTQILASSVHTEATAIERLHSGKLLKFNLIADTRREVVDGEVQSERAIAPEVVQPDQRRVDGAAGDVLDLHRSWSQN